MYGADSVFAIGDCTFMDQSPLPATAQVASQQGSYLGRLFSKGFDMKVSAPLPPLKLIKDKDSDNYEHQDIKFASETLKFGSLGTKVKVSHHIFP